MFNSISNNFGAPTISFKDYQSDKYIVLNAHFAYDPNNEAYKQASVLEIKVPDLNLAKSMEAGVFAVYKDSRIYSSKTYLYNFATVLRSWIRDRNTLCIEKLTNFDNYGPIDIYIFAMYAGLNTGEQMTLSTTTALTVVPKPFASYTTTQACVVTDNWVFVHVQFGSSYNDPFVDRVMMLAGLPEDVSCDEFPLIGGSNQYHYDIAGVSLANIHDTILTVPPETKNAGSSSADAPFFFLYLVRDPHPDVTKYVLLYYHSGRCIDAQYYEEGDTIVPVEAPDGYYWYNIPETMPAKTVYAQSRVIESE